MKFGKIRNKLNLKTIHAEDGIEDLDVKTACGADLMSDVLAFSNAKSMLITGLTNPQVIRTSEMIEIKIIIFVRGKKPLEETIELAKENAISLFMTDKPMFEICGRLYNLGLKPEKMVKIE